MKINPLLFACAALSGAAAGQSQDAPPVVVEQETVEIANAGEAETVSVENVDSPEFQAARLRLKQAQRNLDSALASQRLSIAPLTLVPTGDDVIETTRTTTKVEVPGQPTRYYNSEKNVVVVEGRELAYLTIPVLFVEGTAELLDEDSRLAIEDIAVAIRKVLVTTPDAVFDVEGHTSADGSDEMNMKLSADRARRIYADLLEQYNIPTSALAAHGYGEDFARFPEGTEEQMVADRRVLVVRAK